MTYNSTGVAYGSSYVIAENSDEAYQKVRKFLNENDLGFSKDRELDKNVVRCFFAWFTFVGTANWYKGIDKPTFWQRVYKWRISPKTAWTLAHGLWLDGYSK